jgi:outer membrane protein OmpA-like peptidoglycan-associated protein
MGALFKRKIVLKDINLISLYVHIVRNKNGLLNVAGVKSKKESESTKAELRILKHFALRDVVIENSTVLFTDRKREKEYEFKDTQIRVSGGPNAETIFDGWSDFFITTELDEKPIILGGKAKGVIKRGGTYIDCKVENFDISPYIVYLPDTLHLKELTGLLNLSMHVNFAQTETGRPSFEFQGNIYIFHLDAVDNRDRHLFKLPELYAEIKSLKPILREIHISEVHIREPEISLWSGSKGNINLYSLFLDDTTEFHKIKKTVDKKPFVYLIDSMEMTGGSVVFTDYTGGKPIRTVLHPVDLRVSNLSSAGGTKAGFSVSVRAEAGERVDIRGDVWAKPFVSEGRIRLWNVPVSKYAPVYGNLLGLEVEGYVEEGEGGYHVERGEEGVDARFFGISALVRSLVLGERGEGGEFLRVPGVEVRGFGIDVGEKVVEVGELLMRDGVVNLRREEDGKINLVKLLFNPEGREGVYTISLEQEKKNKWNFDVHVIDGYNFTVIFKDQWLKEQRIMRAEQLQLHMDNISTSQNLRGIMKLATNLDGHGSVLARGIVSFHPFIIDVQLNLNELDIQPLKGYLFETKSFQISGGQVDAEGKLSLKRKVDRKLGFSFSGDAFLSDFSSVDEVNKSLFMKINAIAFRGIEADSVFSEASVEEIEITKPYLRLLVTPEKRPTAVQPLKVKKEKGERRKKVPALNQKDKLTDDQSPSGGVKIKKVTLDDAHIDFTDSSIQPQFQIDLVKVEGSMKKVFLRKGISADFELSGMLDGLSPFTAGGRINFAEKERFVFLEMFLDDVAMITLNPYARKYLGYNIKKGNIDLDLEYVIINRDLEAKNDLSIDQLTLGDRVASLDAPQVPLRLALSLMKNRRGKIKIQVPVKGTFDDPKFKLGQYIIKAVQNAFIKVVSSPFAYLGSILGLPFKEGRKLSYVQFDYGSSEILQAGMEKLDVLIQGLKKKPNLKLTIEGYVDKDQDRKALLSSVVFISDDDLRLLARKRSINVKEYILRSGEIDPKRIFLVEPSSLSPKKDPALKNSRVVMKLK